MIALASEPEAIRGQVLFPPGGNILPWVFLFSRSKVSDAKYYSIGIKIKRSVR